MHIQVWQQIAAALVIGFILGVKFSKWYFNSMITWDIDHGFAFIYRNKKWYPYDPMHPEQKEK